MKKSKEKFTFEISLSVLNHLGRNLYRSFATVLGEAISNSWDAGAKNVWIIIEDNKNGFSIKDDGIGMNEDDFQNKFLKIGYSKRKDDSVKPLNGRPYIGRKGIGKLALLSCADRIQVISKTDKTNFIGGVIDNSGLDEAIEHDLTPDEYELEEIEKETFELYLENLEHGTIIKFDNLKEGIKNSLHILKKIVALYFRFSLLDPSFKIFINDDEVTYEDLDDLIQKTEFLWNINDIDDPYITELKNIVKVDKSLPVGDITYKGFIASVIKPRYLKILEIEERVGVDLFVNGRLREKDILKHIPTSRLVENYLYGQIHYDELDDSDGKDRFTSSREGIVADDPKYKNMYDNLKANVINKIIEDWDQLRRNNREEGDPDNSSISKKQRKAEELYNAVSEEYDLPKDSENKKTVDKWVNELSDDASYNFTSYAECFISENLIRKYIEEKKIPLSKEAKTEIEQYKEKETKAKSKGNISINIRKNNDDLSYLSMDDLAYLVDKKDPIKEACLARDANEYKPVRDALAHTALLTEPAKKKLSSVYENIKGRLRNLLESN